MTKGKWELDPFFCTVDFSVKHLAITAVKGCFHEFQANIIADPTDMTTAEIDFTIQVNSLDTRIKDRDAHLLSPDFFDAENYPTIEFKSKEIIKTEENNYDLIGEVAFHGVTKLETFKLKYTGHQIDPMGNFEKIAFNVSKTLKRSDFGLTIWNMPTELGAILISDDILVEIEIQALPKEQFAQHPVNQQ